MNHKVNILEDSSDRVQKALKLNGEKIKKTSEVIVDLESKIHDLNDSNYEIEGKNFIFLN